MSTASSMSQVIFKVQGLKPDVRIKVFFTEFHVHSSILKSNSKFFLKFFDSAYKKGTEEATAGQPDAGFKYELVTFLNEKSRFRKENSILPRDRKLVRKEANAGELDLPRFKCSDEIPIRTQAFEKLLYAIYGDQDYEPDDGEELLEMTSLARNYGALPALSKSLSALLYHNRKPKLYIEFRVLPWELLIAATELRLPKLFGEALIFNIGPWEKPEYLLLREKRGEFPELYPQLVDGKLIKITEDAYTKLCAKIRSVNQDLLAELESEDEDIEVQFEIESKTPCTVFDICEAIDGDKECPHPWFYSRLFKAKSTPTVEETLQKHIKPLMENNLVLISEPDAATLENYFLCITIADEDLPWDTTETDW